MSEYKPIEDLSFREAMAELDSIVQLLEGNSLELEESLEKYERGIQLLAALRERLSGAQQKVDTLMGELEQPVDDNVVDSTLQKA